MTARVRHEQDRTPSPRARPPIPTPANHDGAGTVLLTLQRTAGNRAVQRLLDARTGGPPLVQRVALSAEEVRNDKARAKAVIDPLLDRYFVGQDLVGGAKTLRETREQELIKRARESGFDLYDTSVLVELIMSVASDEEQLLTTAYQEGQRISTTFDMFAVGAYRGDFLSKLEYWKKKAKRVEKGRTATVAGLLPLWCDQATALVVKYLASDKAFRSTLDVIKQGNPRTNGHWYVLANRDPNASLQIGRALSGNEFIIDLWGALRRSDRTTVYDTGNINLFEIEDLESVMSHSRQEAQAHREEEGEAFAAVTAALPSSSGNPAPPARGHPTT